MIPPVVDVIIVGAGFAGLGMGIRLSRETDTSFLILERANDVGGTWRDNTYPGVACDIPSHLYSFSFRQKPDWSHVFAPGAEIQEYLRECAREEGLLPRIRFGADVHEMRWDEIDGLWVVVTEAATYRSRSLVVAAGRLSEARTPAVDGAETFTGTSFHSSHWDHQTKFDGKRIGVVGTGASAIQLVPRLAERAAELVVFQRSAPYIVPRVDRAYSETEKRLFTIDPTVRDDLRSRFFWAAEEGFAQRIGVGDRIEALRNLAHANLETHVTDPSLRERATPTYEIGCKRVLISSDFYPALGQENVTLEDSALTQIVGSRALAESGNGYDLDILVYATGFSTIRPAFADRVIGVGGTKLSDHWSNGMTAFASTVVSGYPNLFIIDGPNASLGHNSGIYMIETQIEYVLGALAFLSEDSDRVLEISASAEQSYTREIDRMSASTVWLQGGCTSWYVDSATNRLTLLWPDFAHSFRETNGRFDPVPYESSGNPFEPREWGAVVASRAI
jgi:cation diffusion facilitator CzcD-associated flavoprotein CzcO